jgi:negative regulator of replication initiation
MPTIKISDEVNDYIKRHGHFGETHDDVLRRQLMDSSESALQARGFKERRATVVIMPRIENNELVVRCPETAQEFRRPLPAKDNYRSIRLLRKEAFEWVKLQGGTTGQENAVSKKLSDNGYYTNPPPIVYE